MKYVLSILAILFLNPLALADEKSCFPVGAAVHDRECYDFDQKECLKVDDIYSCAWGKRSENHVPDEDQLICENSRCPNAIDDVEDLEEE